MKEKGLPTVRQGDPMGSKIWKEEAGPPEHSGPLGGICDEQGKKNNFET